MAKINFFFDLLGLVLLTLNEDTTDIQIGLQGLILTFAITHFSMLVASHMSETRCASTVAWRLYLICLIVLKMAVLAFAMYLCIVQYDETPQWFLIASGCCAVSQLIYESIRTRHFMKALKSPQATASVLSQLETSD